MIDLNGPKGRIVEAALTLAKTRPWHEITLLDIAGAAGVGLVEMKEHFSSKAEMLRYFTRKVDEAVIATPAGSAEGELPRDRIFEVIMNRFDVLAPFKPALKAVTSGALPDPRQMRAIFSAQHWMLQAAGIPSEGLDGGVKVAGLAGIYAAVFRTWLNDDDPGMARTMAALDRRLRRGESTMKRMDEACCGMASVAASIRSLFCGPCKRRQADGDTGKASGEPSTDTIGDTLGQSDPSAGTSPGPATGPAI